MPRHVTAIVGVSTFFFFCTAAASAQSFDRRPRVLGNDTARFGGLVHGVVRDEAGRAISDASVVAMSPTLLPVITRSNPSGQFTLTLAPGEYILRATRDGYVSTYREAVRIQNRTEIDRTIVLLRRESAARSNVLLATSSGLPTTETTNPPDDQDPVTPLPVDDGYSEGVWRLRHLMPTALRDVADTSLPGAGMESFRPRPSFVDWVMGESARAAASFFTNTNFTGQVNFLTTSTLADAGGWLPAELPHGIAYISVGAPVGSAGDWTLRGAMSASALSSWIVLGEYTAREGQPHAFSAGVSYSSQPTTATGKLGVSSLNEPVRSVGGIYASDRWHVQPALELDYGLRLDRYDYVSDQQFASPQLGFRLRLLPGTHVTMTGADHALAPGANEFLPPTSTTGPWLPPERTFAPLLAGGSFRAERVRDVQVGIEQRLTTSDDATAPVLAVGRFQQSAQDQVATIFGLDAAAGAGSYYVATPGSVSADGWIVRLTGRMLPNVDGSVQYTTSEADWTADFDATAIEVLVPSVVRPGRERLHDVTTAVNTSIPETSTKIGVAYRVTASLGGESTPPLPSGTGRFNVEVRQPLSLRFTRTSRTDLVVVVRNLFRDPGDPGSLYDEALTIAPPLRIMGGVQVKF